MSTLAERFWSKVAVGKADACWDWLAAIRSPAKEPRGAFWFRGRHVAAPRMAWELTHGEIPSGLWALHKCDNPKCCNPNHLFLGDAADNARDREQKGRGNTGKELLSRRRTHCPSGHPYEGANVGILKSGPSAGEKYCRACSNARTRAWRKKRAA